MANQWGINEVQYSQVQTFAQGREVQLVLLEMDGTISVQMDDVWHEIGTPTVKSQKQFTIDKSLRHLFQNGKHVTYSSSGHTFY